MQNWGSLRLNTVQFMDRLSRWPEKLANGRELHWLYCTTVVSDLAAIEMIMTECCKKHVYWHDQATANRKAVLFCNRELFEICLRATAVGDVVYLLMTAKMAQLVSVLRANYGDKMNEERAKNAQLRCISHIWYHNLFILCHWIPVKQLFRLLTNQNTDTRRWIEILIH
jgi:hypothetical protein